MSAISEAAKLVHERVNQNYGKYPKSMKIAPDLLARLHMELLDTSLVKERGVLAATSGHWLFMGIALEPDYGG